MKIHIIFGILSLLVIGYIVMYSGYNLTGMANILASMFGFPQAAVYNYRCDCDNVNICHLGWTGILGDAPVGNHHPTYDCLIYTDYHPPVTTTTTSVTTVITPPSTPLPPAWSAVLDSIVSWLRSVFSWLIKGSIIGSTSISTLDTGTFTFSLTSAVDTNYQDGTYQSQYGSWAVIDSNNNIVRSSDWEAVGDTYSKTVQISGLGAGKYVFVPVIYRYDMKYLNGQWSTTSQSVVAKEASSFEVTSINQPTVPIPTANTLTDAINSIFAWLRGLFSWLGFK